MTVVLCGGAICLGVNVLLAGSFSGVHLPKINPSGPRIDVDMSGCVVTHGWSFLGGRHVSVISGADLKTEFGTRQEGGVGWWPPLVTEFIAPGGDRT